MEGIVRGFFIGGEHSGMEYLHLSILTAYLIFAAYVYQARWRDRDSVFALAGFCIGILVIMVGREFSFGKYHGIEHPVRNALRMTTFAAIAALWAFTLIAIRTNFMATIRDGIGRVINQRWPIAATCLVLAASQTVDKGFIYEFQPPELSESVEESLEGVSYLLLGRFLWRLLGMTETYALRQSRARHEART